MGKETIDREAEDSIVMKDYMRMTKSVDTDLERIQVEMKAFEAKPVEDFFYA